MNQTELDQFLREFRTLRDEHANLKREVRRLRMITDEAQYGDVIDPPVAYDTQTLVTNVRIDLENLEFQKKTRTGWVKFTEAESDWTNWHTGTTCSTSNFEAVTGEDVSAAATTMALLRLTGAI